jgi:hypothetical protein
MVITRAVRPPENISFYDFFLESKTSFLWSLRSMGAGPITFFSFCSFPGQTRLRAVKFLMHRRCCDVRRTRQVLRFRFLSLVSQHRFLVDYSDSTYTIHAVYIVKVRRASQLFLVRLHWSLLPPLFRILEYSPVSNTTPRCPLARMMTCHSIAGIGGSVSASCSQLSRLLELPNTIESYLALVRATCLLWKPWSGDQLERGWSTSTP